MTLDQIKVGDIVMESQRHPLVTTRHPHLLLVIGKGDRWVSLKHPTMGEATWDPAWLDPADDPLLAAIYKENGIV